MKYRNGCFSTDDGKRYIPMGMFTGYFDVDWINDEIGGVCPHGDNVVPFYGLTKSSWRSFFAAMQAQGHNAMRLFPRGPNFGSGGIGLDRGGSVNRRLLDTFFAYINTAAEYGIYTQLCLFSMPECSFYTEPLSRALGVSPYYRSENIESMPPYQSRFFMNSADIVNYNDYFSDRDVRECNKKYLREIIPEIIKNGNIFAVELYNEMGWASPYADVGCTFQWEYTDDYLDWGREMVDQIKQISPELPVCISNPGVGLLGHDPYLWAEQIRPNFFSLHNYPDICGYTEGAPDYAAISDMTLKYAMMSVPSMYGEWQLLGDEGVCDEQDKLLLARDMLWLTVLSGAGGCISWLAKGYGAYAQCSDVFARLDGRDLTRRRPDVGIDVSDFYDMAIQLNHTAPHDCAFRDDDHWCPDNMATDGMHRFCVKGLSSDYCKLLDAEKQSLELGVDYDFTMGKSDYPHHDFVSAKRPIKTMGGGYHIKYMLSQDGDTCVVYLRNYKEKRICPPSKSGGTYAKYALRSRETVPLTVEHCFDGYSIDILDLDTNQWMCAEDINGAVELGITSHDYIMIFTK